MLRSHSFRWADFYTPWYALRARELRQDETCLDGYAVHANKFWQNAVLVQALADRGMLVKGKRAIGFGVGQERLPALFARYGVKVTASDQDFATDTAKHWAARELAEGTQSLNRLGICEAKAFARHMRYTAIDMRSIPSGEHGKYDFLWSNCALGHLGSIPAGLDFITDSLRCLAPGGWAVHTTELNILSNDATVTDGDTVVFRLRDLYELQKRLILQGYSVSAFRLTLGDLPQDRRISLAPRFGNDFAKIHIRGHLATQIILIIHKPQRQGVLKAAGIAWGLAKSWLYYGVNKITQRRYRYYDETLGRLLDTKNLSSSDLHITPTESDMYVEMKAGSSLEVNIPYKNHSSSGVMGVATELTGAPIVLATFAPANRRSLFYDKSWTAPNRPSHVLRASIDGQEQPVEFAEGDFGFRITLRVKAVPAGLYEETFSLVQEGVGWIPHTVVRLHVSVI